MTNSRLPRLPGGPGPSRATIRRLWRAATLAASCVAAVIPGGRAGAQGGPAGSVYRRGADAGGNGERIVAAMIEGLGKAETVSARVRQLARVGDTVLKGSGRYLQSGSGVEQRFRLETRLSADTETFDLLEVCDGLFLWNYRKLGLQSATVQRVDVQRVHERLESMKMGPRSSDGPYLGGVQRMLSLVREWFRFTTAASEELDGMPVWRLDGTWNEARLAALLPDQAADIQGPRGFSAADLPEGMPWRVRLSIGQRDLFPFRIEWLAIPGPRPVTTTTPEVVAVFELYDVRLGEPIDTTAFVYRPAVDGLIDVTEQHLQTLAPLRP